MYFPHGRVAHIANSVHGTSCTTFDSAWGPPSTLLGTGSQDEYDKALTLPLCKTCFPDGPRRPETT